MTRNCSSSACYSLLRHPTLYRQRFQRQIDSIQSLRTEGRSGCSVTDSPCNEKDSNISTLLPALSVHQLCFPSAPGGFLSSSLRAILYDGPFRFATIRLPREFWSLDRA